LFQKLKGQVYLRTASLNSEFTGSYKKSVCYFSVVQIIKTSKSLTDIVIFKFLNPLNASKYLEVGFKDG